MSITPEYWSEKDETGLVPDITMRYESYFNTEDGCLYRVVDFIIVQEPDQTSVGYEKQDLRGEGHPEDVAVTTISPGRKLWYIVLEKGERGNRVAISYSSFRGNTGSFHRVKDPAPKPRYRSAAELEAQPTPPLRVTHDNDIIRGGPRHNEPDERRRVVDLGRVDVSDRVGRTVELSSRQRPSSVDHSTGVTRGVVKGPRNVDQGAADFDHTGDSVMLAERENPSGDWKPSPMERERLRGGSGA